MPRSDYTKSEWTQMKLDLLRELTLRGIHKPKAVMSIDAVRPWFAEADRRDVSTLFDTLVSDEGCPLEYVTKAQQAVWVTEPSSIPEYVREHGRTTF